jgi:hypothetical protein
MILDWLRTAMNQVLLGELHQEVSVEFDIELKIARCLLRCCNVKIQGLVKSLNRLLSISSLSPF